MLPIRDCYFEHESLINAKMSLNERGTEHREYGVKGLLGTEVTLEGENWLFRCCYSLLEVSVHFLCCLLNSREDLKQMEVINMYVG